MEEEAAVRLSGEEARRLYGLLASRDEPLDPVLARVMERLKSFVYLTLTIEEIERLQQGGSSGGSSGGARPR